MKFNMIQYDMICAQTNTLGPRSADIHTIYSALGACGPVLLLPRPTMATRT